MPSHHSRAMHLAILALLPATLASVSLQDIQPVVGFSSSCQSAYAATISSCSQSDFAINGQAPSCSISCFSELGTFQTALQTACASQKASGDSLIGAFFTGQGPATLCGDTVGGGGSAASSSSAAASSAAATSTSTDSSSTSSTQTTESSSSATSTISTTTITSGTSTQTLSASTSLSSAGTTTRPAQAQNTNQRPISGGGSPFDISLPASGASRMTGSSVAATSLMTMMWMSFFLLR